MHCISVTVDGSRFSLLAPSVTSRHPISSPRRSTGSGPLITINQSDVNCPAERDGLTSDHSGGGAVSAMMSLIMNVTFVSMVQLYLLVRKDTTDKKKRREMNTKSVSRSRSGSHLIIKINLIDI